MPDLEQQWSPMTIFYLTYFFSALSGIGQMLYMDNYRDKTLLGMVGAVFGTAIVFGAAGTSMGMFYYFKWGSKENPVTAILVGQLVGIRVIKFQMIAEFMSRLFQISNTHEGKRKPDSSVSSGNGGDTNAN